MVQSSDCRKHLGLSPVAGTGGKPACKSCAQVEDVLQQKVVKRLHNNREAEKELDSRFQVSSAAPGQTVKNSLHQHTQKRGEAIVNTEEWKLAMVYWVWLGC